MDERKNLHVGHRERMIEKFFNNPDLISDHEILEIILYSVIKRRDVNALAHRILNTFGSLENVFLASPKELCSIEGVGIRTASEISLFGQIIKRTNQNHKPNLPLKFSYEGIRQYVCDLFMGNEFEQLKILLFDKCFKLLSTIEYENQSRFTVKGEVPELANAIAINKPKYVIIAHNHPSGNISPNKVDDYSTAKIYILCSSHGVTLLDHIIVSNKNSYSYHIDGKLDYIKNNCNLENFFQVKDKL